MPGCVSGNRNKRAGSLSHQGLWSLVPAAATTDASGIDEVLGGPMSRVVILGAGISGHAAAYATEPAPPRRHHPWEPPEAEFPHWGIVPVDTPLLGRTDQVAAAVTGLSASPPGSRSS
jgi:hypothetical protein